MANHGRMPVVPFAGSSSAARAACPPATRHGSALSSTTSSTIPPSVGSSRVPRVLQRLWDVWLGMLRVSHSGTYSVERMLALEEYATTSWVRVLAVCVVFPLPTLVFVVCIELLPLRAATAGWRANYWFWVRHFILTVITMECNACQLRKLVPDLPWCRPRVVALSVFTGIISVGGAILIATFWVFPTPFFMVVVGIPFTSIWVKGFERMVLVELPRLAPDFKQRFDRANDLFNVQGALVSVYPIYNAVFVMLPPRVQPVFVFVLPVIKMVLKKKVADRLVELEDYLPEEAVFTVELFNALYTVNCMQNTTTPATTAVILVFDCLVSAMSLHGLHKRTGILRTLHKQHVDTVVVATGSAETRGLRALMVALLETPDEIDKDVFIHVRVEACVPHLLTPRHRKMLQTLVRIREQCPRPAPAAMALVAVPLHPRASPPRRWSLRLASAVRPQETLVRPPTPLAPLKATASHAHELSNHQKSRLLQQTLRAMFNVEYLVLIEYVECIIPLLYAIYLPILVLLPNGRFYPHTRALQHDPQRLRIVLFNIVVFAALEVASLVAFCWILRRHFNFSPLHQVAFVLEKQMTLVQGKLIVWLIYALQFTIDHQGADFTFKFAWINQRVEQNGTLTHA